MNHHQSNCRVAIALLPSIGWLAGCSGVTPLDTTVITPALTIQPEETSPVSMVVLDLECKQLVASYSLEGNMKDVFEQSSKNAAKIYASQKVSKIPFMKPKNKQAPNDNTKEKSLDEIAFEELKKSAKSHDWLPMRAELMYGERAHAQESMLIKRDSTKGKKYYPLADKLLGDILAKITEPYEYQFQLFIVESDELIGHAIPGGFLYMPSAFFKGANGQPKVHPKAHFVLSHEVAHVLKRHETKELQSLIVDSFESKDEMVAAIRDADQHPEALFEKVKIQKNLYVRHGIDQELQSDSCATKLLDRLYSARPAFVGAVNAFIKELPAPQPDDTAKAALSATKQLVEIFVPPADRHPSSQERTEHLNKMLDQIASSKQDAAPPAVKKTPKSKPATEKKSEPAAA